VQPEGRPDAVPEVRGNGGSDELPVTGRDAKHPRFDGAAEEATGSPSRPGGRRTWTRGSASFSSRSVVLRRQTNRGGSTPCMIRSTGRTSSWRHGTDQTHSGSVATFESNVHNHEDDSVAVLAPQPTLPLRSSDSLLPAIVYGTLFATLRKRAARSSPWPVSRVCRTK